VPALDEHGLRSKAGNSPGSLFHGIRVRNGIPDSRLAS
jgi:hypothetical protein